MRPPFEKPYGLVEAEGRSILMKEDSRVKPNLLLNRASPWLDVDSYLPTRGRLC